MSNNSSGKQLEENLETVFNMHKRFDEALYRANIKKEYIIHLPFKRFIGILASCCVVFSAVAITVTQCIVNSFNQEETSYYRDDLYLAQNYFFNSKVNFSNKAPTNTNYIDNNYIFNTFNPNTTNHYFQIYKITENPKISSLNLTFICNNKYKSFNVDISQKNYIAKINDGNFIISGDYYICEISVNNYFYKIIYLNL